MQEKNKIYVGNLSFNTTEEGLQTAFSEYGDIRNVKLITDFETGKSRGFAFITFENDEAAEGSLQRNGTDLDGRQIRVSIAEERKPKRQSF